jgi:Arc/MetJ family transcription regulator
VYKYTFTQVYPVKTIRVDDEVWEKLMELRTKGRARSVNEVLRQLLGLATTDEQSPQPESKPAQSSSSESQSSPATPSTSGTALDQSQRAGTEVKMRKWSFCPECLNMYDHQGKCPYCGVDLIPLDTEENKMLYLKLKQERGGK